MGNLCFCWQVLHDENEQVLLLTLLALPLSSHSPSSTTPASSATSPFAETGSTCIFGIE